MKESDLSTIAEVQKGLSKLRDDVVLKSAEVYVEKAWSDKARAAAAEARRRHSKGDEVEFSTMRNSPPTKGVITEIDPKNGYVTVRSKNWLGGDQDHYLHPDHPQKISGPSDSDKLKNAKAMYGANHPKVKAFEAKLKAKKK
jgi:hypothetical protein